VFDHHKELAHTVRGEKPNPVFARMLRQAIGGPEGEMRVMNQYLFQAWGCRDPERYRDMLIHRRDGQGQGRRGRRPSMPVY
jgi:manganese catalase